jgi:hypothetical protein
MRTRLCIQPVVPEFTHARVDDWVAGTSTLPSAQHLCVVPPREMGELGPQRFCRGFWKVIQQMMGKVAPDQLPQEWFGFPPEIPGLNRMPNLAGTNFAEVPRISATCGGSIHGDVSQKPIL